MSYIFYDSFMIPFHVDHCIWKMLSNILILGVIIFFPDVKLFMLNVRALEKY